MFITLSAGTAGPRFERLMMGTTPAPVVKDNVTGLMWQGCPADTTGDLTSCTLTTANYNWSQAGTYCNTTLNGDGVRNAGFTDWYLPDIKELKSIVDNRYSGPAVDDSFFPNTPSFFFWSSSPYGPNPGNAWHIYFSNGELDDSDKGGSYHVRCVRKM